jgi:NTP pyrophosphatase (non-canonical NTP hydrolase)
MLWAKFPGVCSYCLEAPHSDKCTSLGISPDWQRLRVAGAGLPKPSSFGAWQRMFRDIYPETRNYPAGRVYAHLAEEMGELAEAVRVFEVVPAFFLNEAPDVFAWILQIQNSLEANSTTPGEALETLFCSSYPDLCQGCAAEECQCPSVLPSTVGRLGAAIPATTFTINGTDTTAFMSVDEVAGAFEL